MEVRALKNDNNIGVALSYRMAGRLKQTTLFGSVSAKTVAKIELFGKDDMDYYTRPEIIDFWNLLNQSEKETHSIARSQLGSSYTVESTPSYILWKTTGKVRH